MNAPVQIRLTAGLLLLLWLWLCKGPLPAAEPRVLISTAMQAATTWRYICDRPGDDWSQSDFDDSHWLEGRAGFGVTDQVTPPNTVGTAWTTTDIWLRKKIDVPRPLEFNSAGLIVRHDEGVEVYVEGTPVFAAHGFNTEWISYDVTAQLRTALQPGQNLVAVHVSQTGGGQYIDIGLVLDPQQQLVPSPPDRVALQAEYDARWPREKAWKWYTEVGPVAGCNYLPRSAVNMTEMWQAETFDPKTIDQELGWAEDVGYNGVRVFVQYLVWKEDPDRLKQRMTEFLAIAEKHNIRVMFVPFCDCAFAGRDPYLGRQDDPVPGVHNSGWVPSPGLTRVVDRTAWPDLEKYIKDLVGHFGHDTRVLIWDLYNEPGQSGLGEKSLPLVAAAFRWAREAKPDQPLTVGAWVNFEDPMSQALLEMSDVVSFHGYDAAAGITEKVRILRRFQRPILCTEWLCRGAGNTFETVLPIFSSERGVSNPCVRIHTLRCQALKGCVLTRW